MVSRISLILRLSKENHFNNKGDNISKLNILKLLFDTLNSGHSYHPKSSEEMSIQDYKHIEHIDEPVDCIHKSSPCDCDVRTQHEVDFYHSLRIN